MRITSPAFAPGGDIPQRYTCDGDDLSPPLEWLDEPAGTRSFLISCEDPDAPNGTFRHWIAYDIPASRHTLNEGEGKRASGAIHQARNDFGRTAYGGPCPPHGHGTHHYHFRIHALSAARLPVAAGAPFDEVMQVAAPHVLAEAEIVGCYAR